MNKQRIERILRIIAIADCQQVAPFFLHPILHLLTIVPEKYMALGQGVQGAWTVCTSTMDYEYLLYGLHSEAYPADKHAQPQSLEPTRVCQNTWTSLQQRMARILRIIKRSPLSIMH